MNSLQLLIPAFVFAMAASPSVESLENPEPAVRKEAISYFVHRTKETQAVLPSVLKLLHDDDVEIRDLAIQAVFNIHPLPSEASPTIRELLGDKNSRIRKEAVRGLGHQKTAKDFLSELKKLVDDNDAEVRAQLASTAGHIGKEAIPIVAKLLEDSDEKVRGSSAYAVATIGPAAAQCKSQLQKILQNDGPDNRQVASNALSKIQPENDKSLTALLEDPRIEVRRGAMATIEWKPEQARPVLPQLIKLLKERDQDIQRGAVQLVFWDLKPLAAEAVPFAPQLLKDDRVWIRITVIDGLAVSKYAPQFVPQFKELLSDPEYSVRMAAARALNTVLKDSAIPIFIRLLDDGDSHVRSMAADVLGEYGAKSQEAVAALKRLLTDKAYAGEERGLVCNRAGLALVKITGDKHYLDGLPPIPPDGL